MLLKRRQEMSCHQTKLPGLGRKMRTAAWFTAQSLHCPIVAARGGYPYPPCSAQKETEAQGEKEAGLGPTVCLGSTQTWPKPHRNLPGQTPLSGLYWVSFPPSEPPISPPIGEACMKGLSPLYTVCWILFPNSNRPLDGDSPEGFRHPVLFPESHCSGEMPWGGLGMNK